MSDFKIFRAKSSELFIAGAVNPRLVIEEGCWYVATDTAELYLGVLSEKGVLTLKQINVDATREPAFDPTGGDEPFRGIIGAYIDESGELWILFSDNTEESLGKVVGKDGKDGLTTKIKIGDAVYEQTEGIIELPNFVTEEQVAEKIANLPKVDLTDYAKMSDIPDVSKFITEVPAEYITETELAEKNFLTEHQDLSEYAKKSEIPTNYLTSIPDEYVTEDELAAKGFITDLSGKADKDHTHAIQDIEGYVEPDLSEFAKLEDLDGLATKEDLSKNYYNKEAADKEFLKPEVLEDYYKKDEANAAFIDKCELAAELANYASTNELTKLDTEIQDLSNKLDDKVCTSEFSAYAEVNSQALSVINTALGAHTSQLSAVNGQLGSVTQSLGSLSQQVYRLDQTKADKSEILNLSAELAKKADASTVADLESSLASKLGAAELATILQDYYKKAETYSQIEVDDLLNQLKSQIGGVSKLNIKVIETVPEDLASVITEENVIYLVPTSTELANSSYDEYLLVAGVPERIGSTAIDLTGYVKEESLESYVDKDYLAKQGYLKEIPSDYIKNTDLEESLKNYYTSAQADDAFISADELSTTLLSYLLASEAESIYVPLVMYNAEVAKLTGYIQALQENKVEKSILEADKAAAKKALDDTAEKLSKDITDVANDLAQAKETHHTDLEAIQQTVSELNEASVQNTEAIAKLVTEKADKSDLESIYTKEVVDELLGDKADIDDLADYDTSEAVDQKVAVLTTYVDATFATNSTVTEINNTVTNIKSTVNTLNTFIGPNGKRYKFTFQLNEYGKPVIVYEELIESEV